MLKTPVMQRNLEHLSALVDHAACVGAVARVDNKVVARKNSNPVTVEVPEGSG